MRKFFGLSVIALTALVSSLPAQAATLEQMQAVIATMEDVVPGLKLRQFTVTLGSETKSVGLMYLDGQQVFFITFDPGEPCGYVITDFDTDGFVGVSNAEYVCEGDVEPQKPEVDFMDRFGSQAVYDMVIEQALKPAQ